MQTSSTQGWTNYQNAFDSSDSTYATCGTATDYLQVQYDLPVYVAGFSAKCNFAASVARACNLSLSTYDTDKEVLIANGIGGAETETYTTSATFDDTYMRTLRFKLINTTAGTAPTTDYPTRVKTINLAVDPDSKMRIKDLSDGQKDVLTSYENRTGTWKKVKDTVLPEDYSTHELTHQNYYFVEKKAWTMPTFTNNTTYGTLSSTSIHSSHNIWNAFDGVIGGTNKYLSTNTSAGDITWNAPHYVSINSCKFYQTDIITRFPRSVRILGDGIEIANVSGYSQPASGAYLEVICNKQVYKRVQWLFGNNFGGDAGVAIGEIVLDINKGSCIYV